MRKRNLEIIEKDKGKKIHHFPVTQRETHFENTLVWLFPAFLYTEYINIVRNKRMYAFYGFSRNFLGKYAHTASFSSHNILHYRNVLFTYSVGAYIHTSHGPHIFLAGKFK